MNNTANKHLHRAKGTLNHSGLPHLITGKAVANIFSVPVSTIYEHARTGLLPAVRLGRAVRFRTDDIETFIRSGGKSFEGGWRREPEDVRS